MSKILQIKLQKKFNFKKKIQLKKLNNKRD